MKIRYWKMFGLGCCLAAFVLPAGAEEPRFDSRSRTYGVMFGHGWSWEFGSEIDKTDIRFGAFHPQMGGFLTDRFEMYGEGTLFVYHEPTADVAGGLLGLAGRYHFTNDRLFNPYLTTGGGLIWTTQDENIREIDRIFNFQIILGAGVRITPRSGPGWIIEFRNHHISNAGTAGENIGINAAALVAGVQWVIRK